MISFNIQQCRYESDSWKRAAVFLQDENGYLLRRLIELLKSTPTPGLLEKAEYFQAKLIEEDSRVKTLRSKIGQLEGLLVREMYNDGKILHLVAMQYHKVKEEMETTERDFRLLKADFNDYVNTISASDRD